VHHFVHSVVKKQFHPGVSKYFDATRKKYAFFNPGVEFHPGRHVYGGRELPNEKNIGLMETVYYLIKNKNI